MHFPKVSVIIPVYNTELYLDRCLTSAICQTLQDIEMIVVNDASTDRSLQIIQKFQKKDQRIQLINFRKNKGSGIGRNTALKRAKGRYILFLDSDDWLEPFAAQRAYEKAIATKVELVLFGYNELVDLGIGKRIVSQQLPTYDTNDHNFLKYFLAQRKGFSSVPWVYLYSKKMLLNNQIYFSEGIYFEDVYFTLKVICQIKKIAVISDVSLYNYRLMRKNSVTGKLTKKKIEDLYTAHLHIKDFLNEKGIFKKYEKEYLIRFLVYCVMYSFNHYLSMSKKEKDKELNFFMRSLRKSHVMNIDSINVLNEFAAELGDEEREISNFYRSTARFLMSLRKFYIPYVFVLRFTTTFRKKQRQIGKRSLNVI